MTLLRRTLVFLVLICLGCSAQSAPPETVKAIERQVRGTYSLPPTVKITVGALKPSEFANYDVVPITLDGGESPKQYDFLLSKDHKTLFRLTKFDLTKDPYAETMKKIDVTGRPTRGNKEAKVVAVNYDDFECPFCSHMHQNLFPGIFKEYGDRVLFIYKDFPLVDIHPWATHAAVDANCLAAQNSDAYWAFADYMHANQEELKKEKSRDAQLAKLDQITVLQGQRNNLDLVKLQSCIKAQKDDAVKASMKEAEGLGVNATPTMFVNGEKVDGAVSAEELRAVLDRALNDAGVPVPAHAAAASASSPGAAPSK
ncbi:MAG TPA: thioredoxin domain-containing protein [Terriglobales bacterium]|nr:thioredoxin domain-containing protein [Terriglobales bacterium]